MPRNYRRKGNSFEKRVKRIIAVQSERKFGDIDNSTLNPSTTATSPNAHITGITQGDQAGQRDGNEMRVKSINLKYRITQHASAEETFVRVVMVRMKGTVADTIPDWNDIFVEDGITSVKDHRLAQRFTVMYDKVHCLCANGTSACYKDYYKKCDYKVKFNGGANTDYEHGQIFVWFVSNQSTNTPTVIYSSQVSFTDS